MNLKDSWNQLLDNFSFVRSTLEIIRNWGMGSTGKKVLVYAFFSLIVVSLPSYHIYTLFESSKLVTESNNKKREYLVKRHSLESAIEIINMCIDGRDKKLSHEEYYCNFAQTKYAQFNDIITIDDVALKKAQTEGAYELMVLDLNGQLMNLEYSKLLRNLPKDRFGDQLTFILRDIVVFTFLGVYVILMIGLFALFNWKQPIVRPSN